MLNALEIERDLLERRDWTWHFRPAGLRSFAPVREYILAEAWDNLDQFLHFHPSVVPLVQQHDRGVKDLEGCCLACHGALVSSQALRDAYREIAAESPLVLGGSIENQFGAYSQVEDFLAILAEYIINNTGELPSYHVTSKLWNRYRDRLTSLRELPDIEPYCHATLDAGAELERSVNVLFTSLTDIRSDLSITYDVPFVPEVTMRG